jgi:hypothetical protein
MASCFKKFLIHVRLFDWLHAWLVLINERIEKLRKMSNHIAHFVCVLTHIFIYTCTFQYFMQVCKAAIFYVICIAVPLYLISLCTHAHD